MRRSAPRWGWSPTPESPHRTSEDGAPADRGVPEVDPEQVAAAPVRSLRDDARSSRRLTVILVLGVVLVAMNLRAAVTSLGSLLTEVSAGLGLSGTLAGVVTMLPALSFAGFGIATPFLARRYPPARILVAAMVVLAVGYVLRAATSSAAVFLLCSALALSGIAVANVLLPALVRQRFPRRVGLMTGVYTMSLVFGTAAGAAAAVPIAELAGSWRVGLGSWALLAVVATLPWLAAAFRPGGARGVGATGLGGGLGGEASGGPGATPTPARVRPARTGLGWAMGTYFGTQAMNGYAIMGWLPNLFRDAGFEPTYAGLLLAGVTGVGVPLALAVPWAAAHVPDLRPLVLLLTASTGVAYAGLLVSPAGPELLWVLLLAVGQAAFPLGLAMIGLRARTSEGTVSLSAFTQSIGYLLAGLGPLLVGVLYEVSGGWTAPLGFLLLVVAAQAVVGLVIARPRFVEDAVWLRRFRGTGA